MAIKMMISKEEFEADKTNTSVEVWDGRDIYLRTTHQGLVLAEREANGYHDSDFYATVWNAEKGKPEEIMWGTTRGWTYPNRCSVDASPEIKALYEGYSEKQRAEARARYEAEKAKMPEPGRKVRVIKGRKLPIGTIAESVWLGEDVYKKSKYDSGLSGLLPFSYYPDQYRVGLRLLDGSRVFVSAANVEVINEG
jgi:hypothetical protein